MSFKSLFDMNETVLQIKFAICRNVNYSDIRTLEIRSYLID